MLAGVAYASNKVRKAQTPVSVFGHQLSTSHQIMALNIASVPILFLVGAGSALFWTLGNIDDPILISYVIKLVNAVIF